MKVCLLSSDWSMRERKRDGNEIVLSPLFCRCIYYSHLFLSKMNLNSKFYYVNVERRIWNYAFSKALRSSIFVFLKWIIICSIRIFWNYVYLKILILKIPRITKEKWFLCFISLIHTCYMLWLRVFGCRSQTSYLFMSTYGIIKTIFPICSYLQAKFCSPHFVSVKYQVNFK